jgi:spore coat protein U-like protein
MGRKLLRWILLSICLLGAGRAAATCAVTAAPAVSLGNVSSLALITTAQGNIGGAGLKCASVIVLLANNYIRVTLQTTPLVLSDGAGHGIPFKVFTRNGGTELQPNVALELSDLTILGLLAGATGLPLYFQVPAGPNVPAGTYTATVNLNWQYAICENGVLVLCGWQRSPGLTQNCPANICTAPTNWGTGSVASIQLTLMVSKACIINSTPPVSLGNHALISQFGTTTTTVGVTCTNTEGYTIGFDSGQNYQAPWRRLASGTDRINYNLYFPSTSTVWTTSQTQSATGSGAQQNYQFDTTLDPTQPNVPAGTYNDNVTLIINY